MLEEFRDAGLDIAYATNVVTDDLYVASEPDPGDPLDIVRQILVPHRLVLRSEAGVWFIVPEEAPAAAQPESGAATGAAAEERLDNVIVAASRYEISRDFSTSSPNAV